VNRRDFILLTPALFACGGKPGEGYRGAAWVASGEDQTLTVVDLLAFNVRRRVAISGRATRLIPSSFGGQSRLYACDFAAGWIEEVDCRAYERKHAVQVDGPLAGARLQPGERRLWAAAGNPPRLIPLDLEKLHPGRPILLPAMPLHLDVAPEGARACLTLESGEVALIDLAAQRLSALVRVGESLGAIRFRSDGRAVVVADLGRRLVSILDPAGAGIVVELPLALRPDRMWMKRDGGQIFISGEGRDAIAIVYPYRTEVAQTFLSGRKPGEMADSAAPAYLFVSNPEANSLTIFDIDTQKVVAVTQVGIAPGPVAVTPDQSYALVLNRGSGDMAVIRTAAITPGREKRVPLFTMIPVAAGPSHAVVVPA
jgi:DNA-binding beta-propeller fold protein YncE